MNAIETNETDVYDMHSLSTFLPCGIDNVTEDDIVGAGLAEDVAGHATIDEDDVPLDDSPEDSASEAARMKEEDERTISHFKTLSTTLQRQFEGPAPWIDLPPATAAPLVVQTGSRRTISYEPRVFLLDEANYANWIQEDGRYRFFTWRKTEHKETEENGKSRFEWWEKWTCHRSGKPENKSKKSETDKTGQTKSRFSRDSMKTECEAAIFVHKFKGAHPPDPSYNAKGSRRRVRILYYYKHTGHTLGATEDLQHQYLSEEIKFRIEHYVKLGLDRQAIRAKLTPPPKEIRHKMLTGRLCRDDFITNDDVSNICRAYWKRTSELDSNPIQSLCKWMTKLESSDQYSVFRAQNGELVSSLKGYKSVSVGFTSPWQLSKLRLSAEAVGLDSTHKVSTGGYELYTIIIQDPLTMRGVPVAFMLTNDQSARPLELWLSEMNKLAGPFKHITTDDSRVEFRAIQDAFEGSVKIHLCLWHVARAWSQKIRQIVRVADKEETLKMQEQARNSLHDIMYESEMRQANLLIVEFRQEWSTRFPEFADYIEDNYIGSEERRKKWMKAYRTGTFYAAMDTNNFVESWHNTLKNTFLGKHYKLRPDRVVYLLSQVVISYFEKEELQAQVQVGRLTRGQIADILRQREVRSMDDEIIQRHAIRLDGKYCVKSFSLEGHHYNLTVKNINGTDTITECDCPYFCRLKRVCKHILMAFRRFHKDLSLPPNNIFRFAPKRCLPVSDSLDDSSAISDTDTVEKERVQANIRQENMNLSALAASSTLEKYLLRSNCDQDFLDKLYDLVRDAQALPLKEDSGWKRKKVDTFRFSA